MGALPDEKMTADEYLRWAKTQAGGRHELVGGDVVMMSPETVRHVEVKSEAWLTLRNAIGEAGIDCRAYADGVSIRIDDETVREPDVTVQCSPADQDAQLLAEPVIVVEVMSPSSVRSDTGAKLAEYFTVPSVRHYLIVDPFNRLVIRHSRQGEERTIGTEIHRAGAIALDPPGITFSTEDLFGSRRDAVHEGAL